MTHRSVPETSKGRTAPHPAFRSLLAHAEGTLPAPRAQAVEAHLATGCSRCRGEAARVRKMLGLLRAGELAAPPAWALSRAVRLFDERPEPRGAAGLWRRLVGRLVLDSHLTPVPVGVRAAGAGERQLLFRVPGAEIDLRIALQAGRRPRWDLRGQVLPSGDQPLHGGGATLTLERQGRQPRRALADDTGEFQLRAVPRGRYDLRLMLEGTEILLRDILVGSPDQG